MFKYQKKIELDGGESKIVRLKVNMPKMEGTILGAVAFQGEGEIEESNNKGVSFEIKNEINTVYGIAVNFPTTKNYSFKIGKPFLEPMPSYYAVRLPITMDSPLLLKDVQIDYEVEFKGEKLFFSKEKIDFAPMTKTNFSIPFDYEEIEQNKPYILKGTLTYKDKDGVEQTMDFKSQFEYTVKKDKNDNKITKVLKAPIEKGGFPYWILLLFPVIGIVVYMKKKTKYFVLLTDEQPSLIIDKESPNFDKLQPKNKTANDHNYKFVHYYTKKQSEQNGEYYYAYHKTINNKNDRV
ncbi:WxL protein host-binding domain-containing protein [Siminovitchia sediminis]|uniref:WxL protein host-binding domain-containing protein n=1 Tax=Siminovitchia sediminis TaxID=1274353 RepID=A0ABW4KAL8_9BACI